MQRMYTSSAIDGAKHEVIETSKIRKIKDEKGHSKINEYTILLTLGEGSYGKVKLAEKDGTREKYAIKILKKSLLKKKREAYRDVDGKIKYRNALEDVRKEIAIMKKIQHPNVVRLHEVIENPENDRLYMDYAEGGQVIDWDDNRNIFINKVKEGYFSETELRSMFRQIILGLDYVHQHSIVHRDLKPQNILRGEGNTVKICDFGVSSVITEGEGDDLLTGSKGTYHFMPPETLKLKGSPYHGKAADIWSLGITFYAFTYFKVPFLAIEISEVFDMIREKPVEFPNDREVSDSFKDLLIRMMDKNPETRIKMKEIKDHPWVNEGEDLFTDIPSTNLVTVTHEEIHGAFTRLETLMLAQRFIRKLKTKASFHLIERARSSSAHLKNQEQNHQPKALSGFKNHITNENMKSKTAEDNLTPQISSNSPTKITRDIKN